MGVFVFDPLSLFGMDLVYVQIVKKNQERMEENDITERLLPSLVRVGDFVRFGSLTIRGADIDQSLTSSQQSLSLTPSFATSSVSQSPPLTQSARQLIVSTYHSLGATHLTVQHHHAIADRFPVTATFSENDSKLFVVDFASAVGRFNVEVKDVVRIEQTWQRDQLRDVVILPKIGEWGDHPLNENGQTSTQLTPTKTDDRDETPPHVKKKLKMLLNRTKTKEKEMPRKEDKQDNKEKPELEEAEALPPSHPPSTDHFRTPTPAQHNTPQSAIPRPKIVRRASGRTKKRTMPTQNSTTPPSRRESQEETEAGSAAVQFVHPPHFVNSSSTQSDTSSPAGSQPTSLEHRKCILLLYWLHSTLGEQFYQYTPSILHLAVAQQQLQRTPSEQAETQTMPTISAFCAVLPEWVKTSLEMMKVVLEEDSLIPLPFHSYSHLETKAILSDFQTNRQTIVFTFPTPIQYTPLHLLSSPTFAHSPTDPRTRHRVSLLSHYPSSLKQFTRQNEDGLVICEIVLEVEDVFVPLTRPFVPSTLSVLVQSDQQVDVHPIHPFHHMSSRPLLLFPFAPKHFDGVAAWNTINDTITTLLGNENKRPAFDVILTPLDEERDVGGHCVRFAVVDTTVLHVGLEARS
ncbi:hypothetical protein BLNAU_22509 [Blattamonas nauphoetae]|uniref:Uncharacterized protein n=1 Tax=Blattamonas nauphoetae TaxID=2049346 RepID=A0ABQ9WSU4_9EUKA|nr:hypothetical protein BLNAU_22509 [Blattamonas nauphoetae]